MFIVLGLAAGVFAWRRWRELRIEVTRRERAEGSLCRSEASFRQIVEQAQDIIYKTDVHGRFTFCNPTVQKLLNYSEREIIGRHFLELIKPEECSEVEQFYHQQVVSQTPVTYREFSAITKDGAELLIGQNVQLLTERGRVKGFQAVARDITEQRRAEDTLRQMKEYRNLFRLANDAILILDVGDGRVLDVNEKACEIYGISREEFIGRNIREITQDSAGAELRLERLRADGRLDEFETIHTRADGSLIHLHINPSPIEYRGQQAILSVNRDITERKKAEQAQASLQRDRDQLLEQLQLQIEVMPLAFILTDSTYRTTYWNPAAERIFGFTKLEMIGTYSHKLLVPPESQTYIEGIFEQIAAGEVLSSSFSDNVTKDGRRITCEWYTAPLRKADGTFIGLMSMAQDITERKQSELMRNKLEAQLRQSQKMEAVGQLAGGIAHDFNNILAAIIGYCELALMELRGNERAESRLSKVLQASNRAKELVRQILTFSRQEEHERKPISLQPVIDEALKLLRSSLPSSIEIHHNIEPTTPPILGDPTQIHQVMMNLGTNAGHAMSERGGVLEVSLAAVEIDAHFAEAHPGLQPGTHVRLVVSDSGCGMDRATRERIFEPFFTTKAPGSGTGLGLAVVHGIVKKHGGVISVYSEAGRGTTFNLYLPAHDGETTEVSQKETVVAEGSGEHILLVDDEEDLAALGTSILERLGYRVTSEVSSIEALKTFSSRPDDFDLVITDQTMPNMSGVDLAKVLLGIRPEVPIILATGYSTAINPEKAKAIGIGEFLLKPHTAQSLSEAIRRAFATSKR
jgi:PAS domain S-box-containing protein